MDDEGLVDGIIEDVVDYVTSEMMLSLDKASLQNYDKLVWSHILSAFSRMSDDERDGLKSLIRLSAINCTSNLLGILDGNSQIKGEFIDFSLTVKGGVEPINGYLQDVFLSKIEEENS